MDFSFRKNYISGVIIKLWTQYLLVNKEVVKLDIGQKIKNARISKGLTQEELGTIVGVQKSAIAKYESGRVVNIKRKTLQKLANVLDIKGSELIGDTVSDEMQEKNDTAVGIVMRLGKDEDFCELVKLLYKLDSNQLSSVKNLITSFMQ